MLFEYRFLVRNEDNGLPTGEEARNWTLSTGIVNFLEWLPGGFYTFQVGGFCVWCANGEARS